jgi:hypothetical protein
MPLIEERRRTRLAPVDGVQRCCLGHYPVTAVTWLRLRPVPDPRAVTARPSPLEVVIDPARCRLDGPVGELEIPLSALLPLAVGAWVDLDVSYLVEDP